MPCPVAPRRVMLSSWCARRAVSRAWGERKDCKAAGTDWKRAILNGAPGVGSGPCAPVTWIYAHMMATRLLPENSCACDARRHQLGLGCAHVVGLGLMALVLRRAELLAKGIGEQQVDVVALLRGDAVDHRDGMRHLGRAARGGLGCAGALALQCGAGSQLLPYGDQTLAYRLLVDSHVVWPHPLRRRCRTGAFPPRQRCNVTSRCVFMHVTWSHLALPMCCTCMGIRAPVSAPPQTATRPWSRPAGACAQ